mmetsp:Transcript_36411/g.36033  ORF Transcript_36411/g.36033 Transcript_36411/m.36033 type:complete len:81 (+) Transcript_36411:24-266(+)|eukprot:CAMPEP_0197005094 /NCGR_PEP_ID=MMETSP1380-20130617/27655_1 /TAXON_ID=5936 /ORGANISM="Euplotes crassus, Strain CT5" /LENGTH=80 /DNA_ID=CAMNT_0042424113 /DNA_START=23 /DNA_END=265 /DNA_ORIENTATION=-
MAKRKLKDFKLNIPEIPNIRALGANPAGDNPASEHVASDNHEESKDLDIDRLTKELKEHKTDLKQLELRKNIRMLEYLEK